MDYVLNTDYGGSNQLDTIGISALKEQCRAFFLFGDQASNEQIQLFWDLKFTLILSE